MKPGYKTTEFWTSAPGAAALVELASNATSEMVQVVSIVGAVVLLCWYTMKRTEVKVENVA